MGFFNDLLKSSSDWTHQEIRALYYALVVIAVVDEDFDKKEQNIIVELLANQLQGEGIDELVEVMGPVKDNPMPSAEELQKSIDILSNMHSKKKQYVMYAMCSVAKEDGDVSDAEIAALNAINQKLKVRIN